MYHNIPSDNSIPINPLTVVHAISNKQFDIVRKLVEHPIDKSWDSPSWNTSYCIIEYLIRNNAPLDILKSMIDKLTDDKQETLNKLILLYGISDDVMLFILDAGANPNARYFGESIFIRMLKKYTSPSQTLLLLDHGANPNSKTTGGACAIDICRANVELHLVRYGATESDFERISRVLIICDMMLYIDDGVPSDWIREIKGCLY